VLADSEVFGTRANRAAETEASSPAACC
jgi:hypothetical protein